MRIALFICLVLGVVNVSAMQCRWTTEGTNAYWQTDEFSKHLKDPPSFMKSSCEKPVCIGWVYCADSFRSVTSMAGCQAVKSGADWKCPTATACFDDQMVLGGQGLPEQATRGNPGDSSEGAVK